MCQKYIKCTQDSYENITKLTLALAFSLAIGLLLLAPYIMSSDVDFLFFRNNEDIKAELAFLFLLAYLYACSNLIPGKRVKGILSKIEKQDNDKYKLFFLIDGIENPVTCFVDNIENLTEGKEYQLICHNTQIISIGKILIDASNTDTEESASKKEYPFSASVYLLIFAMMSISTILLLFQIAGINNHIF